MSDHDGLIAVAKRWERMYRETVERRQRAEALISWVDGMCVDEADHMVIRAGINRYWEERQR